MRKVLTTISALLLATTFGLAQDLRVMSLNLRYDNPGDGENRWELRKDAIMSCIDSHKLDLLATQEGLAHQIEFLDGELEGYTRIGVAREDGKKDGEYTAVYFKNSRFELVESKYKWLSETPDTPSFGWDAACKRLTTSIILKDKLNGKRVHLINTHFDHAGEEARRQSPQSIIERVKEAGNDAVIFAGDLNATHGSEPINILLADDDILEDSYLEANKQKGINYTYHGFKGAEQGKALKAKNSGDQIIDYIMYNDELDAKSSKIVYKNYKGRVVSDHYPVFAVLEYND